MTKVFRLSHLTSYESDSADETGLAEVAFPATCPFTMEQILDPAFFPDGDA